VAFGRKKSKDTEPEVEAKVDEPTAEPEPIAVTTGPYDPEDVADDLSRLDLGGLLVPVPDGTELRVDVNPEGNVVAAVAVNRASQMQLNPFAAPRREGIWDDVRTEIAQSLAAQPGSDPQEVDGPFGRELHARIPAGQAGQTTSARFIGADGPRWFLRGLITGPAATDPVQAAPLEELFRGTVVVRGNEAMAPRDAIPLRLPREAAEAAAHAAAGELGEEAPPGEEDFNPFERGPEITETR
jgi:hypothetical protein